MLSAAEGAAIPLRRDMDLIRELLLKLEDMQKPHLVQGFQVSDPEIIIEGQSDDALDEHVQMLFDAGFIESGTDVNGPLSGGWYFKKLTWSGRDFLDSVREPKVWAETKNKASKVGGWTTGILVEIAKGVIKGELAKLGVPLG